MESIGVVGEQCRIRNELSVYLGTGHLYRGHTTISVVSANGTDVSNSQSLLRESSGVLVHLHGRGLVCRHELLEGGGFFRRDYATPNTDGVRLGHAQRLTVDSNVSRFSENGAVKPEPILTVCTPQVLDKRVLYSTPCNINNRRGADLYL